MEKLKLILGMLWASCVTVPAFIFYIMPLWLMKRYHFIGRDEFAWVWEVDVDSLGQTIIDRILRRVWKGDVVKTKGTIIGMTTGNVVVVTRARKPTTIAHEKSHVKQFMKLGPAFLIIYVAYTIRYGYKKNPLELASRLESGESD